MTATTIFLADLHRADIVVRANGHRLIVEAPTGVVTTQLRDELARRKEELILALRDSIEPQIDAMDQELLRTISNLLAAAYQRHIRVPKVPVDGTPKPPSSGVALSDLSSVHGGGRQDP